MARAARALAALAVAFPVASGVATPRVARPEPLPDLAIRPPGRGTGRAWALASPVLRARAADEGAASQLGDGEPPRSGEPEAPSLDFDLLGAAKPPPEPADAGALRLRRRMLGVHQGVGLGLLSLQLATTVVGQLNYSDRFPAGPDTGRYRLSHKALAYTTLGVFAVNGAIALLAPSAKAPRRFDRVMVHRIAMFTAAAGMAAQAVLGVQTRDRVGRLDQERLATVHLAVGYATLAAMLTGVGAMVF